MSFTATKKEWSEIYCIFRLLADASVSIGTVDAKRNKNQYYPIVELSRIEHNGERRYKIEDDDVHIIGEGIDKKISRTVFSKKAVDILELIKTASDIDILSTNEIESFLDEIQLFDLEAKTQDRTTFHLTFFDKRVKPMGIAFFSKYGKQKILLDGGRAANLKLELTGNKFSTPEIQNINAAANDNDTLGVAKRMNVIERLGGFLKYSDVSDRVFRCNLSMIDLHLPRLLTEMVRLMHLDGIVKIKDLTKEIKAMNPLKVKSELIEKHQYYEHKVKELLLASVLGMRPAKIYKGEDADIDGLIFLNSEGELFFYSKTERVLLRDFLFHNTRLLKGSTEKDRYGYLEKENGKYFFKLNLKIGFTKM